MNETTYIWVVGCPRSGTTFLTNLIGQNCDLMYDEPGHDPALRRGAVSEWDFPEANSICFKWCENFRVADEILERFPNSYFVHIIRNRKNNVFSMAFPKETAFPPRDFPELGSSKDERLKSAMRTWVEYNKGCLDLRHQIGDRYIPVFYEHTTDYYDDIEDITGIDLLIRPTFKDQNIALDQLKELVLDWSQIPGADDLISEITTLRELERARILSKRQKLKRDAAREKAPTNPQESLLRVLDELREPSWSERCRGVEDHPSSPVVHPSTFGGLWVDYSDAPDVIAGQQELGQISPEEADALRSFHEKGYLILQRAIPAELIDAVTDDLRRAWRNDSKTCMASYYQRGEKFFVEAAEWQQHENEAKLLDLHMVSDSCRRLIFAEPLKRLLQLIFNSPAVAFQSLGFERGSQQGIHSDVAFVRVDSPRQFAASWIALEDVTEGNGELEYYPGSHRLPDYIFPNGSPWADPDIYDYTKNLHEIAAQAELSLERFLAKKGDVLIWNAGLFHGGARVVNPGATRRSVVTHYCPTYRHPPYFAALDEPSPIKIDEGGYVCGQYSTAVVSLGDEAADG